MDMINWLSATAKFMAKDRPDLYPTAESALSDLTNIVHRMQDDENTCTMWGGFVLHRWVDDGMVEWEFSKKVSSAAVFEDGSSLVLGWTRDSGTLKEGIDLPDVSTM